MASLYFSSLYDNTTNSIHRDQSTCLISDLFNGVPIMTELLQARDASMDCTRDGRHIIPWTQCQNYYVFNCKICSYYYCATTELKTSITQHSTSVTQILSYIVKRHCIRYIKPFIASPDVQLLSSRQCIHIDGSKLLVRATSRQLVVDCRCCCH